MKVRYNKGELEYTDAENVRSSKLRCWNLEQDSSSGRKWSAKKQNEMDQKLSTSGPKRLMEGCK
jgi:hypothetical protein